MSANFCLRRRAGGRFGFGISGIAQRADLAVFNPYDATESTNFSDSGQGIEALVRQGASVVNMSLGVENYVISPEWAEVFDDRNFRRLTADTVIVKAAGNDGAVQDEDVSWYGNYENLLLVGSVGPDGEISEAVATYSIVETGHIVLDARLIPLVLRGSLAERAAPLPPAPEAPPDGADEPPPPCLCSLEQQRVL